MNLLVQIFGLCFLSFFDLVPVLFSETVQQMKVPSSTCRSGTYLTELCTVYVTVSVLFVVAIASK
jgi:hypothetical protein